MPPIQYTNEVLYGQFCTLRPVQIEDAEFIMELRNDARRARYISAGSDSVDAQRLWIRRYLERRKLGEEYYFVACDINSEAWGVIRLYDIQADECTGGSWVMRKGSPTAVSLETYLLPIHLAFKVLSKQVMHIDVRKANTRVWMWHEMCGAIFQSEDQLNRYYDYTPAVYSIAENRVYSSI